MGCRPDWIMAALIAAGAMYGGVTGLRFRIAFGNLPEREIGTALIQTCLKYTNLIWFMR